MVKKSAPEHRAGARGFVGRARGPSALGIRANGREMHRRPRRWTPTAFPRGIEPGNRSKIAQKGKKFQSPNRYYDDPDTLRRVRAEGLGGVRVGVAAHSSMPDEFVIMRRNATEKLSYHWNSLIIRN